MTPSEEQIERAAKAIALRRDAWREGERVPHPYIEDARAALTAALQGSVVVPAELTEDMRYATWKAQAFHVGATELEAIKMANQRMTPTQREMDQAAYRSMLDAAPAVSRPERGTP